jgi:hypothetical protein
MMISSQHENLTNIPISTSRHSRYVYHWSSTPLLERVSRRRRDSQSERPTTCTCAWTMMCECCRASCATLNGSKQRSLDQQPTSRISNFLVRQTIINFSGLSLSPLPELSGQGSKRVPSNDWQSKQIGNKEVAGRSSSNRELNQTC